MKYLSRDILINKEYLFLDDPVKVTDIYIEKNIFNDIIYVEYIKIKDEKLNEKKTISIDEFRLFTTDVNL